MQTCGVRYRQSTVYSIACYETELILNYLLRFYTTPTMFYNHYFVHQQIAIIT